MPIHKMSVDEAEGHLTELIALVQKGDEVMISEKNKPIVKLVLCENRTAKRVAGLNKGKAHLSDDFNDSLDEKYWVSNH